MSAINLFSTNIFRDEVIHKVANLAINTSVKQRLSDYNLNISNVTWEDTSRYKNSCVGSNISDLTLKVENNRMPIIRSSNFIDVTIDLEKDKLPKLVVGNQNGTSLIKVTLEEYLKNFHKYCGSMISNTDLFSERDEYILTSAQACVLPLEKNKVEFAVDLYNYQSGSEPAVLVIIATAYGTSAQVVSGGNTVLYFNDKESSRLFKAERLDDYRQSKGKSLNGPMDAEEKALNGIYIFQVPLKVLDIKRCYYFGSNNDYFENECEIVCINSIESYSGPSLFSLPNTQSVPIQGMDRGMDRAILSIGNEKGPYKGIKKSSGGTYNLVRDTDKPIRLVVQFYMCTDTCDISDTNIKEISDQIRNIYNQGLYEGSLVVDTFDKPGLQNKNTTRPTATTNHNGKYLCDYDVSLL
ncbi:hypothetical protein [Acanthamoeba polyphaga mimivirus]|uniref:Uncharacterized protein n=3 Tax=Megamimivirinae TaxID=3044648 RepID=A0A2L2DL31_MIMIV|nr:hypothetical protein MegaChil _gp0050 [Megavirus chiliensis]AEQ32858.1 hypothetical protein [Megavirus chiliensis]AGD91944.1 hypothetical protein LBA_00021 [Megavirus lba]AVG45784.1 hypothetical protein [Acanthamoeba polyphaga mimivirus]AVG46892.1 hypothetical protein [Acanthamoeba polyphaga mimivirus]